MPEPISDPNADPIDPVDPADAADPVDADDPEDADPDGAEALGDAGKRALEAMKAKLKAEKAARVAAEKKLQAAKPDAPDVDKITAEAERKATERANLRVLKADLRVAAADLLADPSDAFAFLDLTQFEPDPQGEFDPDEITDALKDLVKRKPHLSKAAQSGTKRIPVVPADPANKPSTPASLDDQIAAAQQAGDMMTVIKLQNRKLLEKK
jgi:hypothetical protein